MRALTTAVTVVGLIIVTSSIAWAQFTTVLNLPPDVLPFPVDSDTQVNLLDGGEIPNSSRSGKTDGSSSHIEVNVLGGTVGSQVQLYGGTTFNVSGGLVGSQLQVFSGATVNVTGGRILESLTANNGSNIYMSGGMIGPQFRARLGSSVSVTGGKIGSGFGIENGSQVSLSDGEIASASIQPGGIMSMTGGSAQLGVQGSLALSGGTVRQNFNTLAGAEVHILGGEYRLDGVPIAELQDIGDSFTPLVAPGAVLSGTLADGTPFAFSSWNGDDIAAGTLVLENVTLPAIGPATILASTDPVPRGIRQGQQLVIDAGGASPHSFNAGWGSSVVVQAGGVLEGGFEGIHATVDIVGGTTKNRMTVYAQSTISIGEGSNVGEILADGQSTIEIKGGATSFIDAVGGSVINLHTGIVTQGMNIHSGAVANILGGTVGPLFRPLAGSTLNIHGGIIGDSMQASGQVTITGGSIGDGFTSVSGSLVDIFGGSFGDRFRAQDGSNVSISGGDFRINGVKIPGLDVSGASLPMNIPAGAVLSGVLSDGTPFAFSSTDGDEIAGVLTLKATTLPPVAKTDLTVPGDVVGSGIRGQHLAVLSGGSIGDNFNVGPNSTVTLDAGGTIGRNLEAVGAVVNIRGGTVGDSLDAFAGTVVNITGGMLGESAKATTGTSVDAHPGSIVNISGGTFFESPRGYTVRAFDDSVINLRGTEFLLDGVPVAGTIPGVPFELLARTGILTGNLKDGSLLNIALRGGGGLPSQLISPHATLNLIVVPEPAGVILLAVAVASFVVRRPR